MLWAFSNSNCRSMQGLPISLALLFHHIRTYDRPHDLGVYRTCVLERSSQMGDDMQEVASPQRELLDCNRSYPSTFKSSNKAREPGFEPGISAPKADVLPVTPFPKESEALLFLLQVGSVDVFGVPAWESSVGDELSRIRTNIESDR